MAWELLHDGDCNPDDDTNGQMTGGTEADQLEGGEAEGPVLLAPQPRDHHIAVVRDGDMLVYGGRSGDNHDDSIPLGNHTYTYVHIHTYTYTM
jgi:hypothetical protein